MQRKVTINGKPISTVHSGISRVLMESLPVLDSLATDGSIELLVPSGTDIPFSLRNIEVVKAAPLSKGWDLLVADSYAARRGSLLVNFSTRGSLRSQGISTIHDFCYLDSWGVRNFTYYRRRITCGIDMSLIKSHAKTIVTGSQTTRAEIERRLHPRQNIHVIGYGWEHMERVEEDRTVLESHSELVPGQYYFSIGTVLPHKNYAFLVRTAKRYPHLRFAVTGHADRFNGGTVSMGLPNITYLGRLSDGQMKACLAAAKALVFPTLYEGFGIPPLEALAVGTPAIVSDIPVLREVYGDTVRYLNPYGGHADLDEVMKQVVKPANALLDKYTWKRTGEQWFEVMRECLS